MLESPASISIKNSDNIKKPSEFDCISAHLNYRFTLSIPDLIRDFEKTNPNNIVAVLISKIEEKITVTFQLNQLDLTVRNLFVETLEKSAGLLARSDFYGVTYENLDEKANHIKKKPDQKLKRPTLFAGNKEYSFDLSNLLIVLQTEIATGQNITLLAEKKQASLKALLNLFLIRSQELPALIFPEGEALLFLQSINAKNREEMRLGFSILPHFCQVTFNEAFRLFFLNLEDQDYCEQLINLAWEKLIDLDKFKRELEQIKRNKNEAKNLLRDSFLQKITSTFSKRIVSHYLAIAVKLKKQEDVSVDLIRLKSLLERYPEGLQEIFSLSLKNRTPLLEPLYNLLPSPNQKQLPLALVNVLVEEAIKETGSEIVAGALEFFKENKLPQEQICCEAANLYTKLPTLFAKNPTCITVHLLNPLLFWGAKSDRNQWNLKDLSTVMSILIKSEQLPKDIDTMQLLLNFLERSISNSWLDINAHLLWTSFLTKTVLALGSNCKAELKKLIKLFTARICSLKNRLTTPVKTLLALTDEESLRVNYSQLALLHLHLMIDAACALKGNSSLQMKSIERILEEQITHRMLCPEAVSYAFISGYVLEGDLKEQIAFNALPLYLSLIKSEGPQSHAVKNLHLVNFIYAVSQLKFNQSLASFDTAMQCMYKTIDKEKEIIRAFFALEMICSSMQFLNLQDENTLNRWLLIAVFALTSFLEHPIEMVKKMEDSDFCNFYYYKAFGLKEDGKSFTGLDYLRPRQLQPRIAPTSEIIKKIEEKLSVINLRSESSNISLKEKTDELLKEAKDLIKKALISGS